METTYGIGRGSRAVCWFAIIVGACCFVVLGGLAMRIAFALVPKWQIVELTGKSGGLFLLFVLALVFAAGCGRLAVEARRFLGFSVGVSDDGVRVDDIRIAWTEIAGIEHPRRTAGLAFRVNTRAGKQLDVYSSVLNAREIEDVIRRKLAELGA